MRCRSLINGAVEEVAMAAQCHIRSGFRFQRKLTIDFSGGEITTDAGLVVLREFDERLGLTADLKAVVTDRRDRRYVAHEILTLLRQRIYQIAAGYEDCNDAAYLRNDPTLRAVVHRSDRPLASQPTLSRLEHAVSWDEVRVLETQGCEWWCRHVGKRGTAELVMDLDGTADPTHGQQQFSFFNGYYDSYLYYPLLIFEAESGVLLTGRLRPGNAMGTRQVIPTLRPLVRRLRQCFPQRPLVLRADAEFAKNDLLDFAEYKELEYVVGMACNAKLAKLVEPLCRTAEQRWQTTGERVRLFTSFIYKAHSWSQPRKVVAKVERTAAGLNPRFVVTNRRGKAQAIFDFYEQRGQAENFIKELKNDLCADRLSCSSYRANAVRLQLHGLAYNLLVLLRRVVLAGTELARSTTASMRVRLFKVAARVQRSCRRLWFHLASGWPGQPLLLQVLSRLAALPPPT
jgi:DDE family transposase